MLAFIDYRKMMEAEINVFNFPLDGILILEGHLIALNIEVKQR